MRGLLIAAAIVLCSTGAAGAAPSANCAPPIDGGTPEQQQVVANALCLMPGNVIERVAFAGQPRWAEPGSISLAFTVPHSTPPASIAEWARLFRGQWEAGVAAVAIRDGLGRRDLGTIAGFNAWGTLDPQYMQQMGPTPITLGKGTGTWRQIAQDVSQLARFYHVRALLHRYTPYGKAPFLELTTRDPAGFFESGLSSFSTLFDFPAHDRYEGIFIQVAGPHGFLQVFTGPGVGVGCSIIGEFPLREQFCHD